MTERAIPIRVPSTANLMVDSADRVENIYPSCWEFQINKNNSIMNGFFSRIGTTEVVMEWCEDNVSSVFKNTSIQFDLSGISPNTFSGQPTVTIPSGFYTAAEALDAIVVELNDISGSTGITWAIDTSPGGPYLVATGGFFSAFDDRLATQLNIANIQSDIFFGNETSIGVSCPDLRPYRYIDIISPQLTYNQDLKDNSTAKLVRDVLCRWYFSDDVPNTLDAYGFPVLMGYTRFCRRRVFNPPKQIKWDSSQPLGNISFEGYDDDGNLLPQSAEKTNFLMTLQLSEN